MEVGAEVNGSLIHQSVSSSKIKEKHSGKEGSTSSASGDEVNLTAGNS